MDLINREIGGGACSGFGVSACSIYGCISKQKKAAPVFAGAAEDSIIGSVKSDKEFFYGHGGGGGPPRKR